MTPIGTSQSSALAGTLTPEALFSPDLTPKPFTRKTSALRAFVAFPASLATPRVYYSPYHELQERFSCQRLFAEQQKSSTIP